MKPFFCSWLLTLLFSAVAAGVFAQVRPPLFEERFDDLMSGIPVGWNNDSVAGNYKWGSSSDGVDGSRSMYFYPMGYAYSMNMLVTPSVEVDGEMMLSFDHKLKSVNCELMVLLSYDGGKTFDASPLLQVTGVNGTNEWTSEMLRLPVSPTGTVAVGFMAIRNTGTSAGTLQYYLDNVVIDYPPKCAAPEDLTVSGMSANSVSLMWGYSVMGRVGEKVDVVVSKDGNIVKEETVQVETSGTLEVAGLEPATDYTVKVRMNCEDSYCGRSAWSDELMFTTLCASSKPGVKYTFDNDMELSPCWIVRRENITMLAKVMPSALVKYGDSGKSLEIPKGTIGLGDTYVFTEAIDHAANDLEISLMAYNNNANKAEVLEVGVQGDPYSPGSYCPLKEVTLEPLTWTRIVVYTDKVAIGSAKDAVVVLWAKDLEVASLFVDDLEINELPDCRIPENVKLKSFDNTGAEFDWTDSGAAGLEVYNVADGAETLLGTLTTSNKRLALEESTLYTLRFKASCGAGKSSGWAVETIMFRTPCSAKSPDYTADFEEGAIPDCWNNDGFTMTDGKHLEWRIQDVTGYDYLSVDGESKYALVSPTGVVAAADKRPKVNIVLPYMDIPEADEYAVEFYIYRLNQSGSANDCVNVYVNDRPTADGATRIGRVSRLSTKEPVTMKTGWERFECLIPVKGLVYIIFENETYNGQCTYLDNISVKEKSSCMSPGNLTVEVDATSATISWDERTVAPEYHLSYTMQNKTYSDTVRGANSYVIDGLTPNTSYGWLNVSVMAVCAAGDTSDVTTDRFALATQCGPMDIPYTKGNRDWPCFTVLEPDGAYPQGSSSITMRGYNNAFALPEFKYENAGGHRVVFDYMTYTEGTIEVGTVADLANWVNFNSVATVQGTNQRATYTVEIPPTTDKYIIFRYTAKTATQLSYIYSLKVERTPDCPDIEGVTTVTATDVTARFNISCPGVSTFDIEYGPKGFKRGEGTSQKVGNDFTLTGLTANTDYDLYVCSTCPAGTGNWMATPHAFKTLCSNVDLSVSEPFFSGFEDGMGCWVTRGDSWLWALGTIASNAYEGSRYAVLNGQGSNQHSDLFYAINLKAGTTYEFSCYARLSYAAEAFSFSAGYCSDIDVQDGNVTNFIADQPIVNTTYVKYKALFTPSSDATHIRIRGVTAVAGRGIWLDNVQVVPIECQYPENVTVIGLTDNGATVGWRRQGVDHYNVKVSSKELSDPETEAGDIYETEVEAAITELSLDGKLKPNTYYYVYLQSVCDDVNKSMWTDPVVIRTLCEPVQGEFSENFEGISPLDCWRWDEYNTVKLTYSGAQDGTVSCTLGASAGASTNLATPMLDAESLSDKMLHMYVKANTNPVTLTIGVTNNPTSPMDIHPVTTVEVAQADGWKEVFCYFNTLDESGVQTFAGTRHIVISANDICHIDAVSVTDIPVCPQPVNARVTDLTDVSAEIDWVMYEEKPCSVLVKTGGETVQELYATAHPFTVSGLTNNTDYVVEITTSCDGAASEAASVGFTTRCGIEAFPYSCDFETAAVNTLPVCWADTAKSGPYPTAGANRWIAQSGVTDGICMQFYATYNNSTGNGSRLQTPVIDLTGQTSASLFFFTKSTISLAAMSVVVSTDGGHTFPDTIAKDIAYTSWTNVQCDLSKYCGKQISVGFHGVSAGRSSSDFIYIDNVRVNEPRECDATASIVINGVDGDKADITITDAVGTAWEVAIGEAGFNPDTLTKLYSVDKKSDVLTGLPVASLCEAYVRVKCDGGGHSAWSYPVKFVSGCAPMGLPYSQDFEAAGAPSDLVCYDMMGGAINLVSRIMTTEVISGAKSYRFANTSGDVCLLLPEFDIEAENMLMEFKYKSSSANMTPFEIGLIHKDSINDWQTAFAPVAKVNHSAGFATVAYSFTLASRSGKDYRIAFRVPKLAASGYLTVDDIRVYANTGLIAPVDIRVSNVTDVSALVSWTALASAVYSEICLNDDESNAIRVPDGETSYNLIGLSAMTQYSVKIRSIDASGQQSGWSVYTTFATNSPAVSLFPYECRFEEDEDNLDLWGLGKGGNIYWSISGKDASGVYEGERALYVANGDTLHSYEESGTMVDAANASLMLDLSEGTYRIVFRYHAEGNNSNDYLQAFLIPKMSGANVPQTEWVQILGTTRDIADWTLYDNTFYVPDDGYYQLSFQWTCRGNGLSWVTPYLPAAIDSVVVSEVKCPAVLGISVDSVNDVSARISWDDNVSADVSYEYAIYKENGEFDGSNTHTVNGQKYVRLDNLDAETGYRFMVRVLCGADGDSEWSEPIAFSTSCAPVEVDGGTPFEDGFDSYTGTDLGCWEHSDVASEIWKEGSAVNASVVPADGAGCVAVPRFKKALMSRRVRLTAGLNYQVHFDACQSLDAQTNSHVRILLAGEFDDIAAAPVLADINVATKEYKSDTVRFNVPENGVYQIGVFAEALNTAQYVALDNFEVKVVDCDIPLNLTVTDITSSSATLTWSGTADSYNVRLYRGDNMINEDQVAETTLHLDGLYGASGYTVEVSSICNGGSESEAAAVTFTTGCDAAAPAPYSEDFEAVNSIPQCWENRPGTDMAGWNYQKEASGNGVISYNTKAYSKGIRGELVSPAVSIEETGYNFSVAYINPAGGPLSIHLSTDGGVTCAETLLSEITGVFSWNTLSVNLDKYVGEDVSVVFSAVNNQSASPDAYIYIDNFRISKVSGTRAFTDVACAGEPYTGYGFNIPSGGLQYGDNLLSRLSIGVGENVPDTLYEVSVYVPLSDTYIVDVYVPGETYTGNGFVNGITAPGRDYTRTVQSSYGCDSTIHLTLLEMETDVVLYDTICEGESYPFCGEELTQGCTKVCTAKNAYGVDSVTTLHLTLLPALVERVDTICEGDFVDYDGERRMTSGVYEADSTYANGCAYKSRLTLTVIPAEELRRETVCEGGHVEIEGVRYDKPGRYEISLPPEAGCAHKIILELDVTPADTVECHAVACEGKPVYFPGFAGIMVTGDTVMYNRAKVTGGDCDSVTRLVVEYHETVETFDTVYTTGQVYTCDNGETLVGTGECVSYGLTADGCDSIHHRYVEFSTGLETVGVRTLVIAPNPTELMMASFADGEWTDGEMDGMTVEVMDAAGRLIYKDEVKRRPVEIKALNAGGLYIVRITDSAGKVYMGRLIVK
ncbi:MAG: choice-of-anchor J domain-containing protein [bacterium]|uniref:Choice-of-anchor J domain-containing protein n=1 Tax=Candidatus Aphodosoma intestinipullorum TaxID=2840674 RepID=A0A940IFJ3_9BACT|nr:choice-of-anchor J domain-containing protein [Candidatus Aphodosoma intestinipullorum]